MPSILNSDDGVVSGTSGLKSTGGNDGLLNIQSNGSTIVAVTGSGISVTGTVSQTGVSTFAAGTASAPSITFTGDTNTGIFSPAADTIAFTEGGAEAMRIDSSGNLLVGTTTTPSLSGIALGTSSTGKSLTVFSSSSGNNGLVKFIDPNGSAALEFVGGTTSNSIYGYGSRPIVFWTNGTERLKIPSDSAGITFPATQSASSDANTLDDYEEGTWTPALTYSTPGTLSVGYQTVQGFYTKIGNVVNFSCFVQLNAFTKGTASGTLQITGLPFTAQNPGNNETPISWSVFDTPLPTGAGQFPTPIVEDNATIISLIYATNNGVNVSWPDADSSSQYKLNGRYFV